MTDCVFGKTGECQLLHQSVRDNCRCPLYRTVEPDQCALCGNQMLEFIIWYADADSEAHLLCPNCVKRQGTCAACIRVQDCRFQTDPSPIPPVIMQTRQEGNVFIQEQIRNPEREAITCKLCECWNGEECGRAYGMCGKYEGVLK
jgi:hypothetical protein